MPTFRSSRQASHTTARVGSGRDSRGRFTKGSKGGFVIDGVDEVASRFMFMAATARPAAGAVAVASAAIAAERMRGRVPVGPPTLHVKDSITSDPTPTITAQGAYADAGPDSRANDGAFVARFLEHGTVHMAPRPFVGPAGDETLPEFIDAIKKLPGL